MVASIKKIILKTLNACGFQLVRTGGFYAEDNGRFMELYKKIKPYTMSSMDTMLALYRSVKYIIHNRVEGDIVICGVWKGGCAMLCALTLLSLGQTKKKIFLYDTFKGMTEPSEKDVTFWGLNAKKVWASSQRKQHNQWCYGSLQETKNNLSSTGYPIENIVFIEGDVRQTLPKMAPQNIALLRLDTDMHDSTRHELVHLYPLLSRQGVIMIDDYEMWLGQRKAVDSYLQENNIKILLHRVDDFASIGIKT